MRFKWFQVNLEVSPQDSHGRFISVVQRLQTYEGTTQFDTMLAKSLFLPTGIR